MPLNPSTAAPASACCASGTVFGKNSLDLIVSGELASICVRNAFVDVTDLPGLTCTRLVSASMASKLFVHAVALASGKCTLMILVVIVAFL